MSAAAPAIAPEDATFRTARLEDLAAIIDLLADDDLGRAREIVSQPPDSAYVRAFAAISADPNQLPVVAELAGAIIGYMQLTCIAGLSHRGMSRCLVESVRVAAHLRGQGVGRRMLLHAEAVARARGCGVIQLTTDKKRTQAHRFYESLGYVASHEGMKRQLRA